MSEVSVLAGLPAFSQGAGASFFSSGATTAAAVIVVALSEAGADVVEVIVIRRRPGETAGDGGRHVDSFVSCGGISRCHPHDARDVHSS